MFNLNTPLLRDINIPRCVSSSKSNLFMNTLLSDAFQSDYQYILLSLIYNASHWEQYQFEKLFDWIMRKITNNFTKKFYLSIHFIETIHCLSFHNSNNYSKARNISWGNIEHFKSYERVNYVSYDYVNQREIVENSHIENIVNIYKQVSKNFKNATKFKNHQYLLDLTKVNFIFGYLLDRINASLDSNSNTKSQTIGIQPILFSGKGLQTDSWHTRGSVIFGLFYPFLEYNVLQNFGNDAHLLLSPMDKMDRLRELSVWIEDGNKINVNQRKTKDKLLIEYGVLFKNVLSKFDQFLSMSFQYDNNEKLMEWYQEHSRKVASVAQANPRMLRSFRGIIYQIFNQCVN